MREVNLPGLGLLRRWSAWPRRCGFAASHTCPGETSVAYRGSAYAVVMEWATLRYDFNDAAKLSVGRFHTPISYGNTDSDAVVAGIRYDLDGLAACRGLPQQCSSYAARRSAAMSSG